MKISRIKAKDYSIIIGKNSITELYTEIKKHCSKRNLRFYISNYFKLALKLNLDGAYLPSFNKSFENLNYQIKPSFIVLGSAHNIKEIRIKERQKVDIIFISSLFKKNNNYLGIYKFLNLQ